MARPRFNGRGFTNPLDSLGLNAESRHRVNPQISRSFMSNEVNFTEQYEAETKVFEVPGMGVVGKIIAKMGVEAYQLGLTLARRAGAAGAVAKRIALKISDDVMKAAREGAEAAKAAGKGVDGQIDDAIEAGAKAGGKVTDDAAKAGVKLGDNAAAQVSDGVKAAGKDAAQTGAKKGFPKPKLMTVAKGTVGAGILVVGYQFMGFTGELFGGDPWAGLTGEDCPDKVEDQGISEEDEDYPEAISECQEKAEKKAIKVFAGAGAGVFLLLLLLLKPKKKKKDEEDEDE